MSDANKVLVDYSSVYKYSFREKDVGRTYPNDEYLRKYKEKRYNSIQPKHSDPVNKVPSDLETVHDVVCHFRVNLIDKRQTPLVS